MAWFVSQLWLGLLSLSPFRVLRSPLYPQAASKVLRRAQAILPVLLITCFCPLAIAQPAPPIVPAQPGAAQPEEAESDLHSLYYSAHLPIDRRLAQDLDQAKRLFDADRFSEGLPLVDRVLEAAEDTFELARDRKSITVATSLKSNAKQLLSGLPPAGVAALELDQGVAARRALKQAIADGSVEGIAAVARRYPVTEAATEAMLIVAHTQMDAGRFGAAANLYEELLGWPKGKAKYAPLLNVRLVWCQAATNNPAGLKAAVERLRNLSSPSERTAVAELIGTNDVESWLAELRKSSQAYSTSEEGWPVEGGSIARNPLHDGGVPHVWPAWEARTVKETHVASRIQSRIDWQQRRGAVWGLVASPIAIGNYIIVRTPSNLVAVDWNTGRRVWETRPEPHNDENGSLNLQYQVANQRTAVSLDAIDQRLWLDAVYASLSSDGERVFSIRNLDSVQMRATSRFGIRVFGRMAENFEEPGNTLTAYDLRTEGKRLWEINGENDPNLAGCFFLGAPIAVDSTLFVLAEFANSIHLIQLDAATGRLLWKQPLANLERSVLFDAGRRLAGCTPSFANGLVISPTGAGSVVAVDPIDRSLKWAYRFEVDPSLAIRTNGGFQQALGAYQPSLSSRWQRNRAIAVGGSVLVTTPECQELYCLDCATGEKLWSIDRADHIYLAGVVDQQVILVGDRHVSLFELASGKPIAQNSRIELSDDATVTGLGVLTNNLLLLPMSGNQIGVVNIATGQLEQTLAMRDGRSTGNLAVHRGTLLSQSATAVTRFDQLSILREQLAASSNGGATSARIQGEIAWGEGNLHQAVELFRKAFNQQPNDSLIQRRLSDSLIAGLRADYQRYKSDDVLLFSLLSDTSQQIDLLRMHIQGSLEANEPQAAFDFATKLYAIDRERLLDADNNGHLVQSERWFAAKLANIWAMADGQLRDSIDREVASLYRRSVNQKSSAELSRLVRYFGGIPAARAPRMALANDWIANNRVSEAELLVLQIDPLELATQFADASASDIPPLAMQLLPQQTPPDSNRWPNGRVKVQVETRRVDNAPRNSSFTSSRVRNRTKIRMKIASQWCGIPWSGPANLAVSHGSPSQLVGWNEYGEVTHSLPLQFTSLQNMNSNVRCIRFGNFAVVGKGKEVAAIDLRSGTLEQGPVLWASDPEPNARNRSIRALQLRGQIIIQSGEQATASQGPKGELCAAAPLGVVVRNDDLLRCYDTVDGDLVWQRREMPTNGTAFGDWQYLFLIADGESSGKVISMVDGSTIGTWKRPEGKTIATCGRNIIASLYKGGRRVVRVTDVFDNKILMERDYNGAAKFTDLAPNLIAVMDPDGQLELLDGSTGTLKFSQQLKPERGLESIHLMASDDMLLLATNTRSGPQHNTAGNEGLDNAPVISGHLYALNAETGNPQWQQPATLKGQGLWQMQPTGSPVLMFVSRWENRRSNRQQGATRLLCLDKRTGRSLVREDQLREPDNRPWAMRIDHAAEPTVSIDLRHTLVTLQFTNDSRPPAPVALADVEGAPKNRSTGLFGIVGRLFGSPSHLPPPGEPLDDDD